MAVQALAASARMVPTRAPSITRAIAAAGVRRERWRLTPAAEPGAFAVPERPTPLVPTPMPRDSRHRPPRVFRRGCDPVTRQLDC